MRESSGKATPTMFWTRKCKWFSVTTPSCLTGLAWIGLGPKRQGACGASGEDEGPGLRSSEPGPSRTDACGNRAAPQPTPRPGGCSRGARAADEGAVPTTAVGGRGAPGREAACGRLVPRHAPRRRELTDRAERHGGRPSAPPRPPGRRTRPSSHLRQQPPPWMARPPALLGPGPLLPARLLTALRRIPVGGCAAILSKLQSQDRPRPQPDWEATGPRRGSVTRPLPGRGRPREATPIHFRLGQTRMGIIGPGLPSGPDLLRAQEPGAGACVDERAGANSSPRAAGP